jgi:hypothetical protein
VSVDTITCAPDCTLKIKVNSCEVTSYIAVYHERDAKGCISIEREDVVLKYTRAIPEIIKKFIEDMLEDDADQTPKIILVKLIKKARIKLIKKGTQSLSKRDFTIITTSNLFFAY